MSKGLVVLIGAGPHSGAGVARSFARSGYALALLARTEDKLKALAKDLQGQGFTAEAFPSDTSSSSLTKAFQAIEERFGSLPSKCAIFHVKNSFRRPFLETSEADFRAAYEDYVVGAFNFSQAALPRMLEKGGTLIFTGTLGAMRTNAQYAAYGGTRAAVRMLAQALAKEFSDKGVHVAHCIANGSIDDAASKEDVEKGAKMSAEAVGDTYVWLAEQPKTLWVHEMDLRPALEKF